MGYSVGSNAGHGLGQKFSKGAIIGLKGPLKDFGKEKYSVSSHVERLFLFSSGSGRDALSDFVTNLCHEYLLKFTQNFTKKYLTSEQAQLFHIRRVRFDYNLGRWIDDKFYLPKHQFQHILLTPKNLLTQSVPWINRPELFERFGDMLISMEDQHLRNSVNEFLRQKLSPPPNHPVNKQFTPTKKDVKYAYELAIENWPDLANYYIMIKEDNGEEAKELSKMKVTRAGDLFRDRILLFVSRHLHDLGFYETEVTNIQKLMNVFSKAISVGGRELFIKDGHLIDGLNAEDVKLVCTLAWWGDGNKKRSIPQFKFVYDHRSLMNLESTIVDNKKEAAIVITTDRPRKSTTDYFLKQREITNWNVVSITGNPAEETNVESVFISYTKADEIWAKWIGEVLVQAGYQVTVQYKDFLPGSNFVNKMDFAIKNTDRTIAVLSREYLNSECAAAEWQAAFIDDPLSESRKLVPLRIEKVKVKGLLGSIVYADLFGLSEESATAMLLGALGGENRPTSLLVNEKFPGSDSGNNLYQEYLEHVPKHIEKNETVESPQQRMIVADRIMKLSTSQLNMLVFGLNPPENEIPPLNASAKDRASALIAWIAGANVKFEMLQSLISTLEN
ncbi:toll/interleukin-1 receptor domain-containing protein [Rubinisphaera italica]|uniref:toll/interleukin-1 receptor domain-containing protein n=1 Tax=Rubinisphaera italica TaxID=2527969 RepID=UPI0011B37038|nr:toll/interleukin-1 receptor domain-containing protein [Rubinisphaera italica]